MARIFITGSGQNRGWHTGSGILSLPVRVQLRDRDNLTGVYPSIARTGDQDFGQQRNVIYDDALSVNFTGAALVWPTGLPASSRSISGSVATPNILQGLIATGSSVSPGVPANISVHSTGSTLSPFVDSRLYIDTDAAFYATGTAPGTLPGFCQKLSSKTSIVINTNPSMPTDFFFSTGTLPDASGLENGVNSSTGYFNWGKNCWEIIGDLTTGSNIDILNKDSDIRHAGILPFVPSNLANVDGELFGTGALGPISRAHGLPFTNFGFPFASKYDATGSQLLSMENHISEPFLVEKIVVEFSASFGPHVVPIAKYGPAIKQFFLMTQKPIKGSVMSFTDTIISESNPGSSFGVSFGHGNQKKLVAYGQVSLLGGPDTTTDYHRDLNIMTGPFAGGSVNADARQPTTGSYQVAFLPKVPAKNNFAGVIAYTPSTPEESRTSPTPGRESARIKFGGRTGFDITDGRSYISPIGGLEVSGAYNELSGFKTVGASSQLSVSVSTVDSLEKTSPFVILPTDRLIFGFCNTPNWYPNVSNENIVNHRYEEALADANVVLSPGAGKITLFGSLLRNGLPKQTGMNQPLTTPAIHEDIHYDIPVYDQFEVEPRSSLSGTYSDNIVTGSMLVSPLGSDISQNVRRIQGSVANGTAGTTGSLQRFVCLTDDSGGLYDSFIPDITKTFISTGLGLLSTSSWGAPVNVVAVDSPDSPVTSRGIDRHWWTRTAFEITAVRSVGNFIRGSHATYNAADVLQGSFTASPPGALYIPADGGLVPSPNFVRDNAGSIVSPEATYRSYKALFGFGNGKFNAPRFVPNDLADVVSKGYNVEIRGYKYGLSGIGGSTPDARFRRSRFGQFRDMLEQRKYPATIRNGSVEYPIEIIFKSREGTNTSPENTHSQNLSTHASSSLPYYDGLTVDRSDDPDTSLIAVDIVIS